MVRKNCKIKCKCGCGNLIWKFDKWGKPRKYLNEHKQRGRKLSPESIEKIRRKATGRIPNQKARVNMGNAQRKRWKNMSKEEKEKRNTNIKKALKNSKKFKEMFKRKTWRRNQRISHLGKKRSKESCLKQSKTMQGNSLSEQTKQKISAKVKGKRNGMYGKILDKNPMWKGGKSFEPYPLTFTKKLKQEILKRDNHRCQSPKCQKKPYKRLAVHHIDYNKNNCKKNNLITLCNPCHFRTNHNRNYWKKLFILP